VRALFIAGVVACASPRTAIHVAPPACDAVLVAVPPQPVSPHVRSLIWRDDQSLLALVSEGDGIALSCGAGDRAELSGLMLFNRAGHIARAYRGILATEAAFLNERQVLVAGHRLGVGALDLETGCYRDAGIPAPVHFAIDRARARFYATDHFDLTRYDAHTFKREAHRTLDSGVSALDYDATTHSLVIYTYRANAPVLMILDGDTLEERGVVSIPAASARQGLWVRPGYGQVAVEFHTPCTRRRAGSMHAMHLPKCLAGDRTGVMLVDLGERKEVHREEMSDVGDHAIWTADGKSLLVACGGNICSWSPGSKPKKLAATFGYGFSVSPSGDRLGAQVSTYSLAVESIDGGAPLWREPLPNRAGDGPKKYCD
jgi:hypothetical protein